MTTSPAAVPPVVLATDGTSSSAGARHYAVQEARRGGAGLRVVHVSAMAMPVPPLRPIQPADLGPYARGVLTRATKEVRKEAPDLAVSTVLGHGSRVGGIVEASRDAQLVVVGRETRRGMDRLLTGATTAGVASHVRCPVVVVADDWQPRADSAAGGHAVVGLRRGSDAPSLLATAYSWASSRGASLTILHAWELPDPYLDCIEARTHADEWVELGAKMLDEALAEWRLAYPDVEVGTRVVHGQAASALLTAAESADLLIVRRAHEHRPFDHLGATVRALLLVSPTPVMVVPTRIPRPAPDLVLEESDGIVK